MPKFKVIAQSSTNKKIRMQLWIEDAKKFDFPNVGDCGKEMTPLVPRDGDLFNKPTKEEIKDVEKLLDYKQDMKKINMAHLKHLEEKKHELKE